MKVKEAAAILGVCIGTVYGLMRSRRLAYYRIGRRRVLDRASVLAFKQASYVPARTHEPPAEAAPYKHLFRNRRQ